MRRTIAILAAAAAFNWSGPALGQEQPEPRRPGMAMQPTLTVTGEGRVSADPDLAVVRLGFSAQAEEASAVQGRVNETMQKVLAAVKEIVPAEQIQTSGLNLYPVYSQVRPMRGEDVQENEPRIVGYRSDMTVTVRVTELGRIGDVIDAGIGAGANRLDGISFELQNDTRARAQALQQAVRSGQEKARAMASALDVEMTTVLEAIEGGAQVVSPMFDRSFAMEAMRVGAAAPIESGQIQVVANVTLRYRISGQGLPAARGDDPGAARPRRDRIGGNPATEPAPR